VSLIDLSPTIAALAGVRFAKPIDGRDLSPLFRGEAFPRDAVFAEYKDKIDAILTDRYHYIHNPSRYVPQGIPFPTRAQRQNPAFATKPRFTVGAQELYDMHDDPLEQDDLSDFEYKTVEKLAVRIAAFRKNRPWLAPRRITSAERKRELQIQGYVEPDE
jgi:arylsulfatase A-like enzyme